CYFRCGFCAFSKGKLAANLRGAPYLVPRDEIVRRAEEAWERGATEVCLQGGIHPAFTGDYYADVVRAIRDAVPDIHVHAFSALECHADVRARGVAPLVGASSSARTRAAGPLRRLHGVRAAALRADGGPHLPQGTGATRADVPGGAPRARGRAARAPSGHHEHP